MELRIRGERAVLKGHGDAYTREIDPHSLALGPELSDALHEWARVGAAVRRAAENGDPGEAAGVVTRRGQQLAARVATVMGTPVHYVDPVTDEVSVISPQPPAQRAAPSLMRQLFGATHVGTEPTPWATGLVVSAFIAVVAVIAMLSLAVALAAETAGWVVLLASAVVTAGLTPSLWLARRVPIVRWIALGAAAGCVLAWFGIVPVAL
ncbi:DUF2537 domain-containing protein [Amycolatopsis cynarae]|uniref:DUF2537 domain-containing protein n=1 Tax=Amycolatopsis cynarae TaxID=2995223 RepID=A0ABY7B4F6_9PSEU|nr:DUF2537 domain-containing protein [Amycolatopsis sp. HUAS 11-8]WAL66309.1 DUF2537 domain-containing protein [Amycolatopsis sp. HUAS 11-8]